jgi:hypothetical protein
MKHHPDVLCAGIIVADRVCTPIPHVPAAGELVMAERMLLTMGGCAANAAVDLVKRGVRAAVVGRVGAEVAVPSSAGAERLSAAADRDDPRPLWVLVRGGPNTLAEAFLHVRQTCPNDATVSYCFKYSCARRSTS